MGLDMEISLGMTRIHQIRPGRVRSGQVRSGQVRSGQVRSGQVRSGQVRSGQVRSNDASAFCAKSDLYNKMSTQRMKIETHVKDRDQRQADTALKRTIHCQHT